MRRGRHEWGWPYCRRAKKLAGAAGGKLSRAGFEGLLLLACGEVIAFATGQKFSRCPRCDGKQWTPAVKTMSEQLRINAEKGE
ncbi:MAG: hypothetical protein H0V78_05640 [Burkholderiales bacterium]|nr:hypothetical protein [Burkholderiales bacterium]